MLNPLSVVPVVVESQHDRLRIRRWQVRGNCEMSKQLNCVLLRPHCASTFRTMRSAPVNAGASSDSVLTEFRIEQPSSLPLPSQPDSTWIRSGASDWCTKTREDEAPEAFF